MASIVPGAGARVRAVNQRKSGAGAATASSNRRADVGCGRRDSKAAQVSARNRWSYRRRSDERGASTHGPARRREPANPRADRRLRLRDLRGRSNGTFALGIETVGSARRGVSKLIVREREARHPRQSRYHAGE